MAMTQTYLKERLSQKFNFDKWKELLNEIFPKVELFTKEKGLEVEKTQIKNGEQLGVIRLDDGRSLAIFCFEVNDNVIISRNRKSLRDISIKYVDQSLIHGTLAFYYSQNQDDYRLTFIAKQTSFDENGNLITTETTPKRYTFLLGANEPCSTAANRLMELANKKKNGSMSLTDVIEAFSVERLNKEFFNGYKAQYTKFLKTIADTKQHRDYVKKLLGRLVFLQFLQKKGWMGVPATNDKWEGGDKNYLRTLMDKYKGNNRILSDVLEPLFFKTLNEKRHGDIADSRLGDNIKIPYLNGGLFDKDRIDELDIDFEYSYFDELINFFSQYNFTIDENDPDDTEVGIDPEMLGHIFENLLEDNKDKGAFYTPKEIVQYMCNESVVQYLKTHTDAQLHAALENLIRNRQVDAELQNKETANAIYELLRAVKVCDPAIGSGAFPMGVLNVLFNARQILYGFRRDMKPFLPEEVKRDIIQNNIFGVDIEQGAVDIARLRFWLSLVVDSEEPNPLPNLDYKIVCGNSLLSRYRLDEPIKNIFSEYNKGKKNEEKMSFTKYKQMVDDYLATSDHDKKALFRQTIEEIKKVFKTHLTDKQKERIHNVSYEINCIKYPKLLPDYQLNKGEKARLKELEKELAKLEAQKNDILDNKLYENAFEWRFEFPQLLNDDGDFMGFDIVIGNPPYIQLQSIKEMSRIYQGMKYATYNKSGDIYCLFVEQGYNIQKENGVLCFIMPNKWLQAEYGSQLRSYVINKRILNIVDFGDLQLFENATTYTCIVLLQNSRPNNIFFASYLTELDISTILTKRNKFETKDFGDSSWVLSSEKHLKLLNKIRNECVCLQEYIKGQAYRGILTGLTEAFLADKSVSNYSNVVPFLQGRDIQPYISPTTEKYLILFPKGFTKKALKSDNISEQEAWIKMEELFPYIMKRLEPYADKGRKRGDKGDYWWELRACDYYEQFSKPKIMYQAFQVKPCFIYDVDGLYCNNSMWILPTNDKVLLGIFNSKMGWWLISKYCTQIQNGYQLIWKYFKNFPIPKNIPIATTISNLVNEVLKAKRAKLDTSYLESQIDLLVYHIYGLTYNEVLVVDPETTISREEYEKESVK